MAFDERSGKMRGHSCKSPIAICGIGLRLPGSIHSGDEFWDILINGIDTQGPIPQNRFNIDGFDDTLEGQGAIRTRRGYFIADDLATSLDTSFFSMSKNELGRCDPQQRLFLEVVRECFDDAGEIDYRGKAVGCYVGTFGQDWYEMIAKEPQHTGSHTVSGYGDMMLANRVSYEYDLRGPSMVLKTACSGSLVALHEACRALQAGDAVAAIVGGTSLILGPSTTSLFFNEGVLSQDASCKTFDARADGFARAEGIACVYLKRIDDALRDGSPVRAVIRGTGSNSDGRSQGLMSPSATAHEALMRSVYKEARLEPEETLLVECHGTGTTIGDPIEAAAVGNVFANNGVFITSVKPNVGHSEGCSGITSIIKAVLILEHGIIPPQIKFEVPNTAIEFAEKKLTVPTSPTRFPADRAERISVNSFGIGGSNAHTIIDSKSQYMQNLKESSTCCYTTVCDMESLAVDSRPERDVSSILLEDNTVEKIFLLSANSKASLLQQIDLYKEFLQRHKHMEHSYIRNIAYTLAVRRELLPHRAFLILNQDWELVEATSNPNNRRGPQPGTIMVFSGQGAQWPMMGRRLITASPSFRDDLKQMDEILQSLKTPPNWSLVDEIQKSPETSRLHLAELAQPLSSALQIALYRLLRRIGIIPTAVIGHSSGEIAAAYAAGKISLRNAMILAYYRGYVAGKARTKQLKHDGKVSGGMAVVGLKSNQVLPFLRPGVCIACENSPSNVTISGDLEIVEEVLQSVRMETPDVLARLLKVDTAYHSNHMDSLAQQYRTFIEGEEDFLTCQAGLDRVGGIENIIFMSSVTCKAIDTKESLSPQYWVSNLVSPVRFNGAVSTLISLCKQAQANDCESSNIFLEIGPHSTLAGPLREISLEMVSTYNYITCQTRGGNGVVDLLSSLGRLHQEGVDVDWQAMYPADSQPVVGLPVYPWDHSGPPYWYESRLSSAWRHREHPHHCLLGIRVVESTDNERLWRNVVHLDHVPWIRDHKVKGDIVFPLAGYIAMVGEAVRQMTHIDGYRLRLVTVSAALVMADDKPTEMVTSLRRRRLTDWGQDEDSVWLDFTISSFNGAVWIKHCEGQASTMETWESEAHPPISPYVLRDLVRTVPVAKLYEALSQIGLEYGPEFQLLGNVTSSATDRLARATLTRPQSQVPQAKSSLLHPAIIDGCIQLLFLAKAKGLCRNLSRAVVPTKIALVEVASSPGSPEMYAHADGCPQGVPSNVIECITASGNLSLRMSGLHVKPLDADGETEGSNTDIHAAARLHWLPDFDFVDVTKLFTPPPQRQTQRRLEEKLALLCILEAVDKVGHLKPAHPHLKKYREWLGSQVLEAQTGHNALVSDVSKIAALPRRQRIEQLESTLAEIIQLPGQHAIARAMKRVIDHAEEIFTGERDTLNLLMEDDVLSDMYDEISFGYGDFVRILSHSRPNLRILEVGAGTGGTTDRTLRALGKQWGLPSYSTYTFTDVSAGFFPQAKKRFDYADNMDFVTLDIGQSPLEQGFSAASYDLIIASNVVHATHSLGVTLKNLEVMLDSDGILLLTEISTVTHAPGFIFGNFSGWWLGEADNREWEPYVLPSRWNHELKKAGMTGAEVVVADDEMPFQLCVTIMSRPNRPTEAKRSTTRLTANGSITLLCDSRHSDVTRLVLSAFRLHYMGNQVTLCTLNDIPPADQDIIACVGLERLFLSEDMAEADFYSFQKFTRHLRNERVLWLTPPFQVHCRDPRSAETLGVARTVRSELGLQFFTLEINSSEHDFATLAMKVFGKICTVDDGELLNADKEYLVENGRICIGRFHPVNIKSEISRRGSGNDSQSGAPVRLDMDEIGSLDTLHWRVDGSNADDTTLILAENTVEVEVRAVGLNFKDVLLAMGVLNPQPWPSYLQDGSASLHLGIEASGIVRKVGAQVHGVKLGARVMLLSPTCALSTRITIPAASVVQIPDSLSFEEAATVPLCFSTAMYSLLEVGRLNRGQSVLIHSACGGVGLAAIQVCHMMGAEIFATVDITTEAKIQHLTNNCKISRDHIFNSRDTSFVAGVLEKSHGRGVDIVLNSLAGQLLHASWRCVAAYGTLIELGKRDLDGHGRLDMMPFSANRTYAGVDIHRFIQERPAKMVHFLRLFLEKQKEGLLGPLEPMSCFEAAAVQEAFRYVQRASHIGKAVVTMPQESGKPTDTSRCPRDIVLDPNAAYLLVGGSTGLGASIATWLVDKGARRLVFLSRGSDSRLESESLFRELRAMGCHVTATAGSVNSVEDVQTAVESCGAPIKGVFHLAMLLDDGPFLDMTWIRWRKSVDVKVKGTWNLHHTLVDQPLEFFWLASSVVSCLELPGQANYSAGCAFLEAFCQYRHSRGLPATVLNICPIKGVGYVSRNPKARQNMMAQGVYFLGEREFLDFVGLHILDPLQDYSCDDQWNKNKASLAIPGTAWRNQSQLVSGLRSASAVEFGYHLASPHNRTIWRRDRRMGFYHNVRPSQKAEATTKATKDASTLVGFLYRIHQEPSLLAESGTVEFLASEIGKEVLGFMIRPESNVDVYKTLAQIGLDSLVAIELRRWFRRIFGITVSVLEIMGAGTLIQLGQVVRDRLVENL